MFYSDPIFSCLLLLSNLNFMSKLFDKVILDSFNRFFQCRIIKNVGRQLLLNAVAHLYSTKKDLRMQERAMHTDASRYLQKSSR